MANATVLCSLDDLKSYLQIAGASKDVILESIKAAVEALVKTYTGRDLLIPGADYLEYYDGDGTAILRVAQRPVVSITSIYSDPARLWPAASLIPASDYVVDDLRDNNAGLITLNDYRFLSGRKATKISYKAGYATVPSDLSHAVKLICAKEYTIQDKRMFGTLTQAVGELTLSLEVDAWPKNAIEILQRYRRISL